MEIATLIGPPPNIFKAMWDTTKALVKSDGFVHTILE